MELVRPKKKLIIKPEKKAVYSNVTYRLPTELIEKIKTCASERKMSCCKIVEKIVAWGIEAQRKNDLR